MGSIIWFIWGEKEERIYRQNKTIYFKYHMTDLQVQLNEHNLNVK